MSNQTGITVVRSGWCEAHRCTAMDATTQFLAIDRARLALMNAIGCVYAANASTAKVEDDAPLEPILDVSLTLDEQEAAFSRVTEDFRSVLRRLLSSSPQSQASCAAALLNELHGRVASAAAILKSCSPLLDLAEEFVPQSATFGPTAEGIRQLLQAACEPTAELDEFLVIEGQFALNEPDTSGGNSAKASDQPLEASGEEQE